jgi:hypothetical protein
LRQSRGLQKKKKKKRKKEFQKKLKKKKKVATYCDGFFGRARAPSARCCWRKRIRSRSSGESAIGLRTPLIDRGPAEIEFSFQIQIW